jgi:hypothetical protein
MEAAEMLLVFWSCRFHLIQIVLMAGPVASPLDALEEALQPLRFWRAGEALRGTPNTI